jgi:hypothetical protein
VSGCIPKLFLVRAIMEMVRNIAGDVKFTFTIVVCSVFARDKERLRRLKPETKRTRKISLQF